MRSLCANLLISAPSPHKLIPRSAGRGGHAPPNNRGGTRHVSRECVLMNYYIITGVQRTRWVFMAVRGFIFGKKLSGWLGDACARWGCLVNRSQMYKWLLLIRLMLHLLKVLVHPNSGVRSGHDRWTDELFARMQMQNEKKNLFFKFNK